MRVEGEADGLPSVPLSLRAQPGHESELPVIRLQMNRQVMYGRSNSLAAQEFQHLRVASTNFVGAQLDREQMVRGTIALLDHLESQRKAREQPAISLRQEIASLDIFIEPRELTDAQRRVEIGHAVVIAERELLVIPRGIRFLVHAFRSPRDAVSTQHRHAPCKLIVVRERQPAFRGGNDLHGMKTEYRDVRPLAVA